MIPKLNALPLALRGPGVPKTAAQKMPVGLFGGAF